MSDSFSITPYHHDPASRVTLYHGESLRVFSEFPDAYFDAILTDPPYSSGGAFRGDRCVAKTSAKYVLGVGDDRLSADFPDFEGDTRDQLGYLQWSIIWLGEAWRIAKPKAYIGVCSDWRQIGATIAALQIAGWMHAGIFVWDKSEAVRPQMGWFRAQCEFVILGRKGVFALEHQKKENINYAARCAPGLITKVVNIAWKQHQVAKPVELMRALMMPLAGWPDPVRVLDPFCGSGTTLVAAAEEGHEAVGIEITEEYCKVARDRLKQVPLPMRGGGNEARKGAAQGSLFSDEDPSNA